MKLSRPAGVQQTPEATKGAVALESLLEAQRLSHPTVCSHFDGKWVICGAGMKGTWLSRGRAAPRYPYRSLQHLCCLMAPLPRGVYWWLPLIPFSWKKHTRREPAECVSVRVCWTGLSVPSHTPVVTVIPGSKIGPVARQPCHPRSWPISILHLEERGLRQSQVAKKKETAIIHPACNGAKRCKNQAQNIHDFSEIPAVCHWLFIFAVLCRIYACFSD